LGPLSRHVYGGNSKPHLPVGEDRLPKIWLIRIDEVIVRWAVSPTWERERVCGNAPDFDCGNGV